MELIEIFFHWYTFCVCVNMIWLSYQKWLMPLAPSVWGVEISWHANPPFAITLNNLVCNYHIALKWEEILKQHKENRLFIQGQWKQIAFFFVSFWLYPWWLCKLQTTPKDKITLPLLYSQCHLLVTSTSSIFLSLSYFSFVIHLIQWNHLPEAVIHIN